MGERSGGAFRSASIAIALTKQSTSVALLALLLAALAMLGPFSIDTYLPSFPSIRADFAITAAELQQTLSVYLLTFAVMTLFHGTLSDSLGRRPVILWSLALYVLASLGCALAQNFGQLLFLRGVQGLSAGAGMVVGRAIIRDSFDGHAAQRLMSVVTMIFGVAPAVAPVIGGWLQEAFGWRAVFVFLLAYGVLLWIACYFALPETLPAHARQPLRFGSLARNYWTLGRSFPLFLLSCAIALNFSGFFIYIVSAPAFIYDLLHLNETQFAYLFVPGIAGVMIGAFISGRVAGRVTPEQTVKIAYLLMFGAVAFNLTYSALAAPALPWSVLPVMTYTIGMALAMPSITVIALDLFPKNRGLTSSLQGFAHSFVAGVVAGLISPLVSTSAVTLALGMTVLALMGGSSWMTYLFVVRRARAPVAAR